MNSIFDLFHGAWNAIAGAADSGPSHEMTPKPCCGLRGTLTQGLGSGFHLVLVEIIIQYALDESIPFRFTVPASLDVNQAIPVAHGQDHLMLFFPTHKLVAILTREAPTRWATTHPLPWPIQVKYGIQEVDWVYMPTPDTYRSLAWSHCDEDLKLELMGDLKVHERLGFHHRLPPLGARSKRLLAFQCTRDGKQMAWVTSQGGSFTFADGSLLWISGRNEPLAKIPHDADALAIDGTRARTFFAVRGEAFITIVEWHPSDDYKLIHTRMLYDLSDSYVPVRAPFAVSAPRCMLYLPFRWPTSSPPETVSDLFYVAISFFEFLAPRQARSESNFIKFDMYLLKLAFDGGLMNAEEVHKCLEQKQLSHYYRIITNT